MPTPVLPATDVQTFAPALPILPVTELLVPSFAPRRREVFPFDRLDAGASDGTARLYYLARNGVYHGLCALGFGAGDVVLMPAYHHGVEVEAVRATGVEIVFYRTDALTRVDLDDVARRLAAPALAGKKTALYLTHVAGWPQRVDEVVAFCRTRGLTLVEDCALSLFARHPDGTWAGSAGDLAIFCLYKTLPVPHGGIAVARVAMPAGVAPPIYSTLHHLAGAALTRLSMEGGRPFAAFADLLRAAKRRTVGKVVKHVQVGTQHLDPAELGLGASPVVEHLLRRVDAATVVVRRRRNHARLLAALGDDALAPFGPPPRGASPLFFPFAVPRGRDRRAFLTDLWARGVEAVDFWSFGDPACPEAEFPEAMALRRDLIELPLHQDLDDEDMDRVARAVKDVLAHA